MLEKGDLEDIPRDDTNLNQESKLRHFKSIGAFVGSALGFVMCGVPGCLAGGGCGLLGGREAIKAAKNRRGSKTTEKKKREDGSESGQASDRDCGPSPGHKLDLKKLRKKGLSKKPIDLDVLNKEAN